jgi:hypothetical protein
MPYIRKTTRRIKEHFVTLTKLTETNWRVTTEMEKLGLWSEQLDDIDVYLVPLSLNCYGWFQPEGHIYIPAINGANIHDYITGYHTRLSDVLRHEWAHALADRRSNLVRNKKFRNAFGGSYNSPHPVWEYHPNLHLTQYASTNPCEDFAETFHFFLKHKGRLPQRLQKKPEIIRKWNFIASLTE